MVVARSFLNYTLVLHSSELFFVRCNSNIGTNFRDLVASYPTSPVRLVSAVLCIQTIYPSSQACEARLDALEAKHPP